MRELYKLSAFVLCVIVGLYVAMLIFVVYDKLFPFGHKSCDHTTFVNQYYGRYNNQPGARAKC